MYRYVELLAAGASGHALLAQIGAMRLVTIDGLFIAETQFGFLGPGYLAAFRAL